MAMAKQNSGTSKLAKEEFMLVISKRGIDVFDYVQLKKVTKRFTFI